MKSKLFDIRNLPMDSSRLVSLPIWAALRVKKIHPDGKPYKDKLRGGALIAANHASMADPLLVGAAFWYRRIHFLVAEAVMSGKVKNTLLRGAGAIRIDRNAADIEAINKSVEVLRSGRPLAVFPQGSIRKGEGVNALKSGITLMAIRAHVPIIPVVFRPRKHWYSFRYAVVGAPIVPKDHIGGPFPTMQDIAHITDILAQRMKELEEVTV